MPPALAPLLDRTQAVLLLLADLLRLLRPPGAALLPLLRACAVCLTVEGQRLLQEKAVRLLVAAFQTSPAQVRAAGRGGGFGGGGRAEGGARGAARASPPPYLCAPHASTHPPTTCPLGPCTPQWGTLLDELFTHVVPYLSGGPRAPRDFPASDDARTCVQMLTAAVLQMIQVGLGGWGWAPGWSWVAVGAMWL